MRQGSRPRGDSRVLAVAEVLEGEQAAGVEGQQHLWPLHDVQAEGLSVDDDAAVPSAQGQNHGSPIPRQHRQAAGRRGGGEEQIGRASCRERVSSPV